MDKYPKPYVLRLEGMPRPKPRMTNRDRWFPSEAVQRYWAWADLLKIAGRQVFRAPLMGAVVIEAQFFLPVPPSVGKAERLRRLGTPHVQKPDLKNLIAGLEDGLNKIAWTDDSQIAGYRNCGKYWAEGAGTTVLRVHWPVGTSEMDQLEAAANVSKMLETARGGEQT